MAEWQQAKRLGKDTREIKKTLRQCWIDSDNKTSLADTLQEKGCRLAKGDRRGFVTIDQYCEVCSLPRWAAVKTKDVRGSLGDEDALPSFAQIKA